MRRARQMLCLEGAVVLLCAIIASPSPAQRAALSPSITTGSTAVTVKFATRTPTTAAIYTSVDTSYALVTLDNRYKKSHVIVIKLAPGRNYHIKVVAAPKKGRSSVYAGSLATDAPGQEATTVTSGNSGFMLNGLPFIPRVTYIYGCADQAGFGQAVSIGTKVAASVIEGYHVCDNLLLSDRTTLFQESLAGKLWLHESDPDRASEFPDTPVVLTWRASEVPVSSGPKEWVGDTYFQAFGCKSTSLLYKNASAETGATTYSTNISRYPVRPGLATCLTPTTLAGEIWTAVAAGVKGLRYASADAGNQSPYDVPDELSLEAQRLATQLDTLQPVLLAHRRDVTTSSPDVRAVAIKYGGGIYIIAVNTSSTPQTASLEDAIPPNMRITRLWESGPPIKQTRGALQDQFGSLGVHIYRALPAKKK